MTIPTAQTEEPGPTERRLIHQPRRTWRPGDPPCPHISSVLVTGFTEPGFTRDPYRECLACGAVVQP